MTQGDQERDSNTMKGLRDDGKIKHVTISFDLRSEMGRSSYVKFGGYDKFAFKNQRQDDMKLLKTRNIETWSLPLLKMTDSTNHMEIDFKDAIKYVDLDPSVRYIYIPANHVAAATEPILKSLHLPAEVETDCTATSVCLVTKSCQTLIDMNKDKVFHLYFADDEGHDQRFTVPIWRYLIDPKALGYKKAMYDDKCMLGIFISNNNQQDHIIIGSEFFREHYVMYDMTPHADHDQDYIQVGIAERNK